MIIARARQVAQSGNTSELFTYCIVTHVVAMQLQTGCRFEVLLQITARSAGTHGVVARCRVASYVEHGRSVVACFE